MTDSETNFQAWFQCARDQFYAAGFRYIPLDETAARDAYNEGSSVEDFINLMVESHESNEA